MFLFVTPEGTLLELQMKKNGRKYSEIEWHLTPVLLIAIAKLELSHMKVQSK